MPRLTKKISVNLDELNCLTTRRLKHKFIFGSHSRDHVTSLLRNRLHWLRVCVHDRVTFTLCLLVHKALHLLGPSYLADTLVWLVSLLSVWSQASLRNSARGDLDVPRTRPEVVKAACSVAGPTVWNNLTIHVPPDIRDTDSVLEPPQDSLVCCILY